MGIKLKGNPRVVNQLFEMMKHYDWIKLANIKAWGVPAGTYSREELIQIFKEQKDNFIFEKGCFAMNIIHSDGKISGVLPGFKKSSEETIEELFAEYIETYMKNRVNPISGFLVRFIPEVNNTSRKELTIGRIYFVL